MCCDGKRLRFELKAIKNERKLRIMRNEIQ